MAGAQFKIIRLRQAASAVFFKGEKFLMVAGADWPDGAWCFPQGGVKAEEKHIDTVKRELKEELGTDKFRILSKSSVEHMYLYPQKIREKRGCEGQFQTIWFVEFLGEPEDINMDNAELSKCSWFEQDKVVDNMMYPEQREVFKDILKEFLRLKDDNII